jgi:hypothetical protein
MLLGEDGTLGWTEYITYFILAWAFLIAVTEPPEEDRWR